jgi:anti-sigma factor RsiW
MDCSTSKGLMLEFVEGTLTPNLAEAVKQHIERCPSCLAELERQSSRTRALQKLGRMPAPDQWEEINRSIRNAGWTYFLKRYGIPAAAFGCAAAFVVLVVTFTTSRKPVLPETVSPPAVTAAETGSDKGASAQPASTDSAATGANANPAEKASTASTEPR